ncbi:MAG: RNA-directed DNA polymerase [Methylovulum sp.]|nr:RNA-directed DNA polymerase [Methylovulum sp.]
MAIRPISPSVRIPVTLLACYKAWRKARRGKRPSANQLAFDVRWLDNLLALKTLLRSGQWQPKRTVSFVVHHPKTREIHAPYFVDRIVHHLLVERLEPLFEPVFIHDSYANRTGKGSHAAVARLQQFMRRREGCDVSFPRSPILSFPRSGVGTQPSALQRGDTGRWSVPGCIPTLERGNDTGMARGNDKGLERGNDKGMARGNDKAGNGWYLQLDIHNFFNSIHRPTLYAMLCRRLAQVEHRGQLPSAHVLALRSLCHKLLAHKVTELMRDPLAAAQLPPHKRLVNAPAGCGLPIGNLTSQFFANVYLNALDQFVKHTLKCRHYVRYVDDFILLADDPEQLRVWQVQISAFLQTTLRLRLKDDVRLQPCCQGIDFLGYRVFTHYRRVRPRVVAHCRAKLAAWARQFVRQHPQGLWIRTTAPALAQLQAMLGSYWGHFSHAHSVRLRHALFAQFNWLPYLFSLSADGDITARWVLSGVTFAQQSDALQQSKLAAHCFIQRGCRFYELKSNSPFIVSFPRSSVGMQPRTLQRPVSPRWSAEGCIPTPERGNDKGLGRGNDNIEYHPEKMPALLANLRRLGVSYCVAKQTGWLRHGTRRRELCEWFIPT